MTKPRCAVLVPVANFIEPHCEYALQELTKRGYFVRRMFGCSAIDFGRSQLASLALHDGFDELMWIDSDVGFNPDDVEKLRSHGLPFCCGIYAKKTGKGFACGFLPGANVSIFGKEGSLKELLDTGFGFVHTRRELYEKIRVACNLPECSGRITPFFLPELVPDDGSELLYLTEDRAFCHRVRKSGCKVMADTTIELSHIGRYHFTWKDVLKG